MKKQFLVTSIIMLCLVSLTLVGCNNNNEEETPVTEPETVATEITTAQEEPATEVAADPVEINIGVLQGPTAMGMIGLMDAADNDNIGGDTYNFTVAGSPDEIVPAIVQGNLDIAAVPSNLASVLYNNTEGDVQVIAINTLGVLHIVESGDEITSIEDLRGRTIYASGHSSAPEFILNYILEGNGLDPETDVYIEWLAEHTEVVARLGMNEDAVAMLPQPFVTVAQTQNDDLRIALDLTAEWEAIQANTDGPDSALIMGVMVARREFIENNPTAIANFLERYAESVSFVNNNVEEAAQLLEYYDIFPAPIAQRAIPHSNVVFIIGSEMQELFSGYLQVLYEQHPGSIGGAMPSEEFYFIQ